MLAILRARKRHALDWGVKYFLTGLALLPLLSIAGVVLAYPQLPLTGLTGQLENAYGFLAIAGTISLCITGMLYKIIPFIVWYAAYSQKIGRVKVPALGELYSLRWQQAGYWSYLAGLAVSTAAILLSHNSCMRVGALLLCVSVAALLVNVCVMLGHLWNADLSNSAQTKAITQTVPSLAPRASR
jgi:hypothetical protein